jgi:hypothetical protein
MLERLLLLSSSLVVSASLVACGESASAPPTPTNLDVNGLQTLSIVLGNNVAARLGVRVTDEQGRGVRSVRVQWRIVAGAGALIGLLQSDQSTASDNLGRSKVDFRATAAGETQVEASVPGLVGSPVVFSIDVVRAPDVVIRFGPIFDCYGTPVNNDPSIFAGPSGRSDVSVTVGATVEFIYAPYLHPSCTARVVSSVEPPGGSRIDSGILAVGGSFRFVALVPGTWTFSDVLNGGSGTLTAVVP